MPSLMPCSDEAAGTGNESHPDVAGSAFRRQAAPLVGLRRSFTSITPLRRSNPRRTRDRSTNETLFSCPNSRSVSLRVTFQQPRAQPNGVVLGRCYRVARKRRPSEHSLRYPPVPTRSLTVGSRPLREQIPDEEWVVTDPLTSKVALH